MNLAKKSVTIKIVSVTEEQRSGKKVETFGLTEKSMC